MKFGDVALSDALGAVLAHSVALENGRLRKGTKLTETDIGKLHNAGLTHVTVAQIEDDDIDENSAAQTLIEHITAPHLSASAPFTGRCNLHAQTSGVLTVNAEKVAAMNAVDEAITLATLPNHTRVDDRQMIATVKIIPYAAQKSHIAAVREIALGGVFELHPFRTKTADLIVTALPGTNERQITKGIQSVTTRLTALGVELINQVTTDHTPDAIASALRQSSAEMTLILGASATSDRRDACPEAVVRAGGRIERFGMPVDPGNLLFLGQIGERPVIGLPGCARAPALNGADWVLERITAGLQVTSADIAHMGVGGLLKEIPTRPQPRMGNRRAPRKPKVTILLLAGGQSRRMQGRDKLMEDIDGSPLLTHCAKVAIASKADHVAVVLGPDQHERTAALDGLDVQIVKTPDVTEGMGGTLRAGVSVSMEQSDAVIVALADMPDLTPQHFDAIIAAFDPAEGRSIVRAQSEDGQNGHPILFGKRFFEGLMNVEGDQGARAILGTASDYLVDVKTTGQAAVTDLDTPEAWAKWRKNRGE
jgi:molybdenum cofactor cytidylyltransferase